MRIFAYEGKFWQFLNTATDLVWLNVLVIFTSIPIFTVGASMSALHYMCIKMWRGEEEGITKGYFKAFKANFKKGTLLWLVELLIYVVVACDMYFYVTGVVQLPRALMLVILILLILFILSTVMVFPFQAQFENTIGNTFKNSALYAISRLPKVVAMIVLQAVPFVAVYYFIQVAPILVFFAFSVPAYMGVILYDKDFRKLGNIEVENEHE